MRLIDYFDRGADLHPERDCLHDGTRGWTYRDVRATTHRIANGLLGAGLKGGDKVAVYSPNHAMAYAALLGSAVAYGLFFWFANHGDLTSFTSLTFLTPVFALLWHPGGAAAEVVP